MQLNLEPKEEFISACNNVVWSIGEVALRYRRGTLPSSPFLSISPPLPFCQANELVTDFSVFSSLSCDVHTEDPEFPQYIHRPLMAHLVPILLHPKGPGRYVRMLQCRARGSGSFVLRWPRHCYPSLRRPGVRLCMKLGIMRRMIRLFGLATSIDKAPPPFS